MPKIPIMKMNTTVHRGDKWFKNVFGFDVADELENRPKPCMNSAKMNMFKLMHEVLQRIPSPISSLGLLRVCVFVSIYTMPLRRTWMGWTWLDPRSSMWKPMETAS